MTAIRNAYKILDGRLNIKTALGGLRHRGEENIKMNLWK
jgi:hypothetical protein